MEFSVYRTGNLNLLNQIIDEMLIFSLRFFYYIFLSEWRKRKFSNFPFFYFDGLFFFASFHRRMWFHFIFCFRMIFLSQCASNFEHYHFCTVIFRSAIIFFFVSCSRCPMQIQCMARFIRCLSTPFSSLIFPFNFDFGSFLFELNFFHDIDWIVIMFMVHINTFWILLFSHGTGTFSGWHTFWFDSVFGVVHSFRFPLWPATQLNWLPVVLFHWWIVNIRVSSPDQYSQFLTFSHFCVRNFLVCH